MKAILLAAGYGKRLKPLTNNIPKCLIKINDKPIIGYWIDALINYGIKDILVNTHYLASKMEDYINKTYGNRVLLSYEEELLNTAGTIKFNKNFINDDDIILIHADNFSLLNFRKFINAYEERKDNILITMLTYYTENTELAGIVKVNDSNEVINFYEKSKDNNGNIANGAVYIINNEVIRRIYQLNEDKIDFSLDIIPKYLGKINTYFNSDYHIDIGNIDNLNKARTFADKNNIKKITLK